MESHDNCWPWYFEIVDSKKRDKELILGYRKSKQVKHITVGGKGKIAALSKRNAGITNGKTQRP